MAKSLKRTRRAERDAGALVRLFALVADRWMLTIEERCALLGGIAHSTYWRWTHAHTPRTLTVDQRERITHIIGIDVATQAYYGVNTENAATHVRRSHTAPNGDGTALDVMLTGLPRIADVRRHIEALGGGSIATYLFTEYHPSV